MFGTKMVHLAKLPFLGVSYQIKQLRTIRWYTLYVVIHHCVCCVVHVLYWMLYHNTVALSNRTEYSIKAAPTVFLAVIQNTTLY